MSTTKNASETTSKHAAAMVAEKTTKRIPKRNRMTRRALRRERLANSGAHANALVHDQPPADIDALRYAFARRISQFVGDRRRAWRTCKEPACRRHRCCRAPKIHCSNVPPPKLDPDGRRAARSIAQVQRMLRDAQARQGEKG